MTVWIWGGVLLFVVFLLALDLGVLNRKAHVIGIREALGWCALWVSVALLFAVVVHQLYETDWLGGPPGGSTLTGSQATLQYLTGYVVEESLSMDNMFVIALIFAYLQIPLPLQHSVLFWGILGAIVLRGTMILGGTVLIQRFD